SAPAHFRRGRALAELQRFDEALASCDRAIALEPGNAEAHCSRGVVLDEMSRFAEAFKTYATGINPEYTAAFLHRARHIGEPRYEEALADFDKSISLNPDSYEAHYNKGVVLQEIDRLKEAIESYDRAIALNPGVPEIHFNKSCAQLLAG